MQFILIRLRLVPIPVPLVYDYPAILDHESQYSLLFVMCIFPSPGKVLIEFDLGVFRYKKAYSGLYCNLRNMTDASAYVNIRGDQCRWMKEASMLLQEYSEHPVLSKLMHSNYCI